MDDIKTFREVIRDIKEGETYTDNCTIISMENDKIKIKDAFNNFDESYTYSENYYGFKLERKTYSFGISAFKAYEEGKEIESTITGCRYKKIDNIHYFKTHNNEHWIECEGFEVIEIRGGWYIND